MECRETRFDILYDIRLVLVLENIADNLKASLILFVDITIRI